MIVLPDVNPDGNAADTRSNANGVDLNRNWPTEDWQHEAVGPDGPVSGGDFAATEPETQALFNFLMAEQPELVISWHAFAAVVEANELPLAAALGELFATISGYEYIQEWTAYPITGEEIVAMEERGIPAFDVELEFEDTESFQRNLDALVAVLAELATR